MRGQCEDLHQHELPLHPAAMLSTRAQRRRETVYGWADLLEELLAKVLEAAGWQEGALGFSQASATVRLVCAGWTAVHDALVKRLVLRPETTDEAMGMLVLRFLAVVSLEVKGSWGETAALTDEGLRAVSNLTALSEAVETWGRCIRALRKHSWCRIDRHWRISGRHQPENISRYRAYLALAEPRLVPQQAS